MATNNDTTERARAPSGPTCEGGGTMGCHRCRADDANAAFVAVMETRVQMVEQESHWSLQVTACACGQRWCVVFTERVDWHGGEDHQVWLAVPLSRDDVRALIEGDASSRRRDLPDIAAGQSFLRREFPSGGTLTASWRCAGFVIEPHD